jgi:hypothetical protein
MDPLTAFGAISVTLMMAAYALESRAPLFVLLFAGACLASSAYGFLQGAWPFGVVEIVWAIVALARWRRRKMDIGGAAHEHPRRIDASISGG